MVPREGGRRLTELAAVADMTKQAMGEFVADLADARLRRRSQPDPADRRAKLVSLTPTGGEAADAARDVLARVRAATGPSGSGPPRSRHAQAAAGPRRRRVS